MRTLRRLLTAFAVGSIGGCSLIDVCDLNPSTCGETSDGATDVLVPPTTYSSLDDPTKWTAGPLGSPGNAGGFFGGAFDGQWIYYLPVGVYNHHVLRYHAIDTTSLRPFDQPGSWESFDTTTVDPTAQSYFGGAFDGRFVYLVPATGSLALRFDTRGTFANISAWESFAMSSFDATADFRGAVFDNRFIYFVPGNSTICARFDTQLDAGFDSGWSAFDLLSVHIDTYGYAGGTFDGRRVYFTPHYNGGDFGLVMTLDTEAGPGDGTAFTNSGSWSAFDLTSVNPDLIGFEGATFDGRYVYLVPNDNISHHAVVARFDTTGPLTAGWTSFDVTDMLDAGVGALQYASAAFDGRYVYFVPVSSFLTRYDTTGSFTDSSSWETIDLTTLNGWSSSASGYTGAVFDGQYLYLVPNSGALVRFEATSTNVQSELNAKLPAPGAHASFF